MNKVQVWSKRQIVVFDIFWRPKGHGPAGTLIHKQLSEFAGVIGSGELQTSSPTKYLTLLKGETERCAVRGRKSERTREKSIIKLHNFIGIILRKSQNMSITK